MIILIGSLLPIATCLTKDMDPTDGEVHEIGVTYTPPILDGIVNVGSSWASSQLVGGAFVAMNATSVADVYMTVELDENDEFKYLWIGVKPVSPLYLKPTNGQWVRIDWDQDGEMDYEDHTGWGSTDGADTKSGAEWMIPWGKMRINPGQKPKTMNSTLIGYSFDLLIHIEVFTDESNSNSATFPNRPIPRPGMFNSTTIFINTSMTPPPDDDGFGIRSKGFWKHQFRTALGGPGHQHIPTENLTNYLDNISDETSLTELKDLALRDALMILSPEDSSDMYSKAVQQLLATWLNNLSAGDQMVDTDFDNETDMMISDAIEYVEGILTDPSSTKKELEEAKDICECINTSGEDD
jgi:hypothetical protein